MISVSYAKRHFHLDLNQMLDELDGLSIEKVNERLKLRKRVREIWKRASVHEGVGEWGKILKRFYLYSGRARCRFLRGRAIKDLLADPALVDRIANYMRVSGTIAEYVAFVHSAWTHSEQLYPDVNVALTESLLRLEATGDDAAGLVKIGSELIQGRLRFDGSTLAASAAPLLLLRFGKAKALRQLKTCFIRGVDRLPVPLLRAAAIVYASSNVNCFEEVTRAAGTISRNFLAETVRLINRILQFEEVPKSLKDRSTLRNDALLKQWFVDMRTALSLRLLCLNTRPKVRAWIESKRAEWTKAPVSEFDRLLTKRLFKCPPVSGHRP